MAYSECVNNNKTTPPAMQCARGNNFEEDDGMTNPDRQKYQKDYWAAYSKNRRQVKGMLSEEEFARIQERADASGNTVWQQIRQESAKYAAGEFLSTEEIRQNIQDLYLEIRGIADIIKSIPQ